MDNVSSFGPNTAAHWLEEQAIDVACDDRFPTWAREHLADPGNLRDPGKAVVIKQFFARSSEVCASLIEEHGTFRVTHIAYTGKNVMGNPVTGIDRWLWEKPSAQALRDRLETVPAILAEYLKPLLSAGKQVRIRDLGGADAPYFFPTAELLQKADVPLDGLSWTVVDHNELAITLGQSRAAALGLEDHLRFVHFSFMRPESLPVAGEEADLVLAIGIVCSLSPTASIGFLNGIKGHMKDGAALFVPTLSDRCFKDDHESYLVYRLIGWHLWPKTENTVRQIFDTAKLKIDWIKSEREGGHYHYIWAHNQGQAHPNQP